MAFFKNHKLTSKEEKIGLKELNNKHPLPDDVKQRLKNLNKKLDDMEIIIKHD